MANELLADNDLSMTRERANRIRELWDALNQSDREDLTRAARALPPDAEPGRSRARVYRPKRAIQK